LILFAASETLTHEHLAHVNGCTPESRMNDNTALVDTRAESPGTRAADNLKGVAVMVLAVGSFSFMDACLKLLSPHYPPLEIASLRGLSTLPIVIAWIVVSGQHRTLLRVRFSLHVARGVIGIGTLAAFTYAVRELPLANAYTLFFVAPLLITAFAVPILNERVDGRRWTAIGVGFVGVLIVLRPTAAGTLTLPGLAVLAAALGYALSAITVRVLGRTDSTQSVVFWLMTFIAVGAGALALPTWRPVQREDWATVCGMGVSGSIGQWALTEAFRRGEASFIAPFEYTALVWGLALDWFIWHTAPTLVTLVGASVIIASGIYLVRRERVHATAEHP
jgi:drug/metabolite transporter (DMT)-like permease